MGILLATTLKLKVEKFVHEHSSVLTTSRSYFGDLECI